MTRIKYYRSGKNYTSEYLTTYEGKRLIVFIHHNIPFNSQVKVISPYLMSIVDDKGKVLEFETYDTPLIAKRKARDLLIHKYNVRLCNEVRQK